MNPLANVPVVAVTLALVLGAALTTVGVRSAAVPEQVLGTAPATTAPTDALPRPTDSAPTPQATSGTAGSSPGPTPPAAARRALAERMLAPRGRVQRLADDADGTGPLDAAAVAALDDGSEREQAAAARRLEALGFEQALGRSWTARERVYLLVVHRFTSAAGAGQLVADVAARRPGSAFRSGTVPGAVAYSGRTVRFWEQRALFARGRYAYRLTFLSPGEDFGHRTFDRLLRRQAAHAARLDP